MRFLVLGSAAGGGFPQWNCNCANCQRARAGDPAARPRSQSSLAVSADGEHWFLLNASPDLRDQIAANPVLHPRHGKRHSPIQGAILTNADVDHVGGLLTLRESQPLNVYATRRVQGVLRDNSLFNILNPAFVERIALATDEATELRLVDGNPSGLQITAFPVPGKVALYLEDATAGENFGTVAEDTVGLRITDGARVAYYLPGCAALPDSLRGRISGADLVFFDGTTWTDDEMLTTGVGHKTGQRMGHMSMSGPDGSLQAFSGIPLGRRVFIHINNTNPVLLDDSPQRLAVEQAGWEIGYDGMEIRL
ncbi:pyrroloquinoline quinone biosynthesis protein PqqB [Sedimenticola sp.]|uniref:pyrroloquinoline quinone biosynthesis protein PqqB n=1 Tax=Sedimenticola sp. TaxID=1940285 RepID=UPI00258A9543|nr:pyrroloquinoline quinone biosynthesis protein PqqB [Sedimenticola sp.]MCW8905188.1 pyrroloquinoline quinone biosynthesis protein PqqB [Sedimenticola sp.]